MDALQTAERATNPDLEIPLLSSAVIDSDLPGLEPANTPITTQPQCTLLGLPAELRTIILKFVVVSDQPLKLQASKVTRDSPLAPGGRLSTLQKQPGPIEDSVDKTLDLHLQPALCMVNRQLRNETIPMFYSDNVLSVDVTAIEYDAKSTYIQRLLKERAERRVPRTSRSLGIDPYYPHYQYLQLEFLPNVYLLSYLPKMPENSTAIVSVTKKRKDNSITITAGGSLAVLCDCNLLVGSAQYLASHAKPLSPRSLMMLASAIEHFVVADLQGLYQKARERWTACLTCKKLRSRFPIRNVGDRFLRQMRAYAQLHDFWYNEGCGKWKVSTERTRAGYEPGDPIAESAEIRRTIPGQDVFKAQALAFIKEMTVFSIPQHESTELVPKERVKRDADC